MMASARIGTGPRGAPMMALWCRLSASATTSHRPCRGLAPGTRALASRARGGARITLATPPVIWRAMAFPTLPSAAPGPPATMAGFSPRGSRRMWRAASRASWPGSKRPSPSSTAPRRRRGSRSSPGRSAWRLAAMAQAPLWRAAARRPYRRPEGRRILGTSTPREGGAQAGTLEGNAPLQGRSPPPDAGWRRAAARRASKHRRRLSGGSASPAATPSGNGPATPIVLADLGARPTRGIELALAVGLVSRAAAMYEYP
mmetsp:Transcript_82512/g.238371  ORF Transcript_82512/g.238371 Transcript_82512/m.238371 type:complete len:258 (-) Transcript_82512:11-784(-)